MKKTIIITGNPVDGFTYTGPFENYVEAVYAAEAVFDRLDEWWVADLDSAL